VLRRRPAESQPPAAPAGPAGSSAPRDAGAGEDKATGKGRPTPKRREAQARQRRPIASAPADRRTAREDARRRRTEVRAALERGDESRMPARDRGPVRRFVRDYVDSRRTIAEYFLPVGVILYVPLLFGPAGAKGIAGLALMGLLILLVLELVRLGIGLSRALRSTFAGDERRGAVLYGLTRAGQMRRFRLPRPQVKVGDKPTPPRARR
jgi:hypothetical protein